MPFAGPGHVTYPPLHLRPGTLRIPEMKRAGKTELTAKFESVALEHKIWQQFKRRKC